MDGYKDIGLKIKKTRKQRKISADDLAKKIGVAKSTIYRYENGDIGKMPVTRMKEIAKILDVDENELLGIKRTIKDKIGDVVAKLSDDRQTNVLDYAKIQLKEQQNTISDNVVDIQEYLYPVTTINVAKGGKGYFYGDNDNNIRYTNKLLNAYDFALDVVGDSMADKINDGDVVCVRKDYDFTNGAIYVVDVDGESLIKKVYDSFDSLMLRSINKEYDDIVVHKSDNVRIIGAVVDCFTPVK